MAGGETPDAAVDFERPEDELVLRCARVSVNPEEADRIAVLLQEDLDWEYLLAMAGRHRVVPLLYWHLDAISPEAVPKTILDRLRNYFHGNNLRNLFLTGELLELLRAFEARGLPIIAYKGPVLAASVYGNLALREFGDLDILVRRRDVPRAEEILASAGYRPLYRLTHAQEAAFLRYHCEHPFTRDDGRSVVDLHWEVVERHFSFPLDTERLWKRLERVPLGSGIVPTFSPEDLLLILCVHGSKDLWEQLKLICDVAELTRAYRGMDWERVTERAGALGGERMLFLGLFLANDLLGAALPEKVSRRVRADPAVRDLAERMRERLFRETDDQPKAFEDSPFHPLHLRMRERLWDRVRYCVRTATTHTVGDWMALPLPRPLFFLYYGLRPIRLIGKYGQRLLKRTP